MLEMEQEIKKRQSLTLTPVRDNTALNQNPILRQSDCSPNGMGGIFKKMINPDFSELDYKKRSLPASKQLEVDQEVSPIRKSNLF